ncbi:hypothetical protein EV126DRAFT_67062 [Verticillium dahliae]|nr:hypothetical protein EV126DRAFT_67062 [Verticillium dahliae]
MTIFALQRRDLASCALFPVTFLHANKKTPERAFHGRLAMISPPSPWERMQRRLCRCRCLSLDTTHRRLRSLPEFTDEPCSSGVHVASRTPSRLLTLVQTQAKRSFGILRLLLAISSTPASHPQQQQSTLYSSRVVRGRAHSLQSLPPGLRWLATSQCRGVSFAQSKKGGSVVSRASHSTTCRFSNNPAILWWKIKIAQLPGSNSA